MGFNKSKLTQLPNCTICKNKRYLICRRDEDDFLAVERCDACVANLLDDEEAARLAQKDGIKCKDSYPCYLSDDDPTYWQSSED